MNKKQILAILLVLIYIVVSSVSATPTISGGLPVNSTPVNMSAYVSLVNESYATITYVNAADATSGIWNTSYYLRDTSRTLTGANIRRDVNNDLLYLWGGDAGNPQGGQIQLYGGANPALDGGMAFAVGDAGGAFIPVMWIEGTTDTPHLDMINHQIKSLLDPTAAQDAVTLNYLSTFTPAAAQLNDYYLNDTSKALFGYHLFRNVDNDFLQLLGGGLTLGQSGSVKIFGADYGPTYGGGTLFQVPNAALNDLVDAAYFEGDTDLPRLNMMGNNITQIKRIDSPTDAVNLSYATNLVANISAGGSGGQIIYFNHSASPDVAGFETLNLIPSGNAEADESVVVNSGLGEVIVDPYVTSLLYPAITTIPPGLWRFRTFHYVSNSGGNTNAVFKVYKRSAAGAETLLFSVVSEDINALSVQEYLTSYAQASAIPLLTTDRLEIKVYGQSTSVSDKTFHFVYDGNIHTSHVLTPISVLSSLDNYAYLPGRSGGQVLTGGTDANDDLILNGTSSATKTSSYVILQPDGGNVGIGTSTPVANLDIQKNFGGVGGTYEKILNISGQNVLDQKYVLLSVSHGSTNIMQINATGRIGMGTQAPRNARLDVIGGSAGAIIQAPDYPLDVRRTATDTNSLYGISSFTHNTTAPAIVDGFGSAIVFQATRNGLVDAWLGYIGAVRDSADTEGALKFYTGTNGGDLFMVINHLGNVSLGGISATASTAQLDTTGQVRFRNYGTGTANFDSAGNLYSISDEKYKTDIKPFTSGLSQILKINPIDYHFSSSSGLDTTNTYTGFSAQNLQTAIPEAVYEKPDIKYEQVLKTKGTLDEKTGVQTEDEYEQVEVPVLDKSGKQTTTLSISDRAIIAAQINAIKELNAKIEAQNQTIAKQEARIAALEKKIGIVKP